MNKVKIGIIGAGRLGGFHAAKATGHNEVVLAGVYDPVEENRVRVAEKNGTVPCDSLEQLLANSDACICAALSTAHFELGQAVLAAGRHLLMEKPLATTAADARRLTQLAREKNLIFQAGHVEQYNPAWLAAAPFLDLVRGGQQAFIEASRTSGYTFRCTDIGVVLDLMIHDLELVLSLTGTKPVEIMAGACTQLGGHEDTALASLLFPNGTIAQLHASRVEQIPSRMMRVRLPQGTMQIDFQTRTTCQTLASNSVLGREFSPEKISPAVGATLAPVFMKEQYTTTTTDNAPTDALELELKNFIDSILRGVPSQAPATRAADAIEVAEEILKKIK
ncbi:MAG: Gfo/Idh/MocA family oxidoreductase [Planctomycetia bacterium]|nr:Gfo/Idh/MocA family oxidoreductase [Planctomycetia bacterium]